MISPLVGFSLLAYLGLLYLTIFITMEVRSPGRRALYLLMIGIVMLVGSVLVRFYLAEVSGYSVAIVNNSGGFDVSLKKMYDVPPYASAFSTLLTGLSLIPVFLAVASSIELIGKKRWY